MSLHVGIIINHQWPSICLRRKQYRRRLKDEIIMTLNDMHLADSIPTVVELLDSPIYNLITLATNDCSYEGTNEYLIVHYLHPLFMKAKACASQADNPDLRQAMDGQFAVEYW